MKAAIAALTEIVGRDHVLVDADIKRSYETDWTGRFSGKALAVIRPADTEDIARVVRYCMDEGIAIVTQGGNTGLVGGSVPLRGGIVLSTKRLTSIGPISNNEITVGAGVSLAALQARCATAGLRFCVDLAARDSATLGGMYATNASGLNHFRFGGMLENTRALSAVTGAGDVIEVAKLEDLCGSEGTLAVTANLTLMLHDAPTETSVMIAGFGSHAAAIEAALLWSVFPRVEAIEYFTQTGMELVCNAFSLPHPIEPSAAYLLVEIAGENSGFADLLAVTSGAIATAVSNSPADAQRLWRYREDHTAAINMLGPPLKFDVRLPVANSSEFTDQVTHAVQAIDVAAKVVNFGHIVDGNFHVNVTNFRADTLAIEESVYGCVIRHGGSVVSEHGVGSVKADRYARQMSVEAKQRLSELKREYDPVGIMNPGVLFNVQV